MKRKFYLIFWLAGMCCSFFAVADNSRLDSLRTALNAHPTEDKERVDLLNELIYELLDRADSNDSAIALINQTILLAKKTDYPMGLAQSLVKRGLIENKNGEFERSIATYKEAAVIFKRLKEPGRELVCFLNAGNSYADHGEYDESTKMYKKALQLADSTKDLGVKSGILNNIGTIYYTKGDYIAANEYFVRAVNVLETLGDSTKLSSAYANVGIMYYVQQDVANAEKYMKMSYRLYEHLDNYKGMASQLLNLGSLYLEDHQEELALEHFIRALDYFERVNNILGVGECYTQLGAVYTRRNEPKKALEYYTKSIAIMKEIGDPRGLATNYMEKSKLHLLLKEYASAEADAFRSIEICNELDLLGITSKNYENLSAIYEAMGQYQKALFYQRQFAVTRDSLFNAEKHKQVAELEAQYETEKKERRIALLSKEKELSRLELERNQANLQRKNTVLVAVGSGAGLVVLLIFILWKRYREKQESHAVLERQHEEIERQNTEIKDSIRYAQRIQNAILPPDAWRTRSFSDSFVLYLPKDIVSGDFYWIHPLSDEQILFAVIDCTGHGVPGAMMSVIGHNHLNQCVNEYQLRDPAAILMKLNQLVTDTLHQHADHHMQDGMDMSLVLYNKTKGTVAFAGAHNPMYVVRAGEILELAADKVAIGSIHAGDHFAFARQELTLQQGDMLYLFSDGFIDQFGGSDGKRFMKKNFRQLLLEVATLPAEQQKTALHEHLMKWRGTTDQLDDVCVMGVRHGLFQA